MEYMNNLLQNAISELLENHHKEILSQFNVDIKFEEIRQTIEIHAIDLLCEIGYYMRHAPDEPEVIVEEVIKILDECGIHDFVVDTNKKYNISKGLKKLKISEKNLKKRVDNGILAWYTK